MPYCGYVCLDCADAVERALTANPHITSVHLDWPNSVVHVGYHADMLDEAAIQSIIEATGCPCEEASADGHAHHAQHSEASARARFQNLRHGVDVQPIIMGTRHDRMQYELPATGAHAQHAQHAAAARPAGQAAMDHGAHGGATMDHGAHGDMGHDMSDPSMAAVMERDMRTKFFIALVLTIPTVLYSPMGMNIFGVNLPTFGLSMDLIMLLLTTPVVFYAGWMFSAGAYQSLRRRALNMSVLVATGVLAAYGGSLALMVLGRPRPARRRLGAPVRHRWLAALARCSQAGRARRPLRAGQQLRWILRGTAIVSPLQLVEPERCLDCTGRVFSTTLAGHAPLDGLIVIIVSLLGGIAIGIQAPIAGAMGECAGGAASSLFAHLIGSRCPLSPRR